MSQTGLFGWVSAQRGPPEDVGGGLRSLWFVLPLIAVVLLALVLYYILFPRLTSVKATEELRQSIGQGNGVGKGAASGTVQAERMGAATGTVDKARVEAALQVLADDEKKIVQTLQEAGGSMLQKEISWKTGYSRVKTHRTLAKLVRRGLVSAEKYYNTNRITLADWLLVGRSLEKNPDSQAPS